MKALARKCEQERAWREALRLHANIITYNGQSIVGTGSRWTVLRVYRVIRSCFPARLRRQTLTLPLSLGMAGDKRDFPCLTVAFGLRNPQESLWLLANIARRWGGRIFSVPILGLDSMDSVGAVSAWSWVSFRQ